MSDEVKTKRKLPEVLAKNQFKPGISGNPLGRPVGSKSSQSKVLSKLTQIWLRADAPENWFNNGLEFIAKEGRTVSDLITARIAFCLATNTKYQNPHLLKEVYDRSEGKIPLRVLSKPGDDGVDDFEELTNAELEAYIADVDRRARLAAARKADDEKPQLPASESEQTPTKEPQAPQDSSQDSPPTE